MITDAIKPRPRPTAAIASLPAAAAATVTLSTTPPRRQDDRHHHARREYAGCLRRQAGRHRQDPEHSRQHQGRQRISQRPSRFDEGHAVRDGD